MSRRAVTPKQTLPELPSLVPQAQLDKRIGPERHPLVEKAEWTDPDDHNERSTGRKVRGVRRFDSIRYAQALGCPITDRDIAAVDRYRDDYQRGFEGAEPGHGRSMEAVSGGFLPGAGPPERQLDALARFRAATLAVGRWERPALGYIVIENGSLVGLEGALGVSYETARQMLLAALQGLVEFYEGLAVGVGDEG